ncbi:hypothetical protein [Rhizobium leguminosarum]|uniref:hypothetical protein n=1 Tax=Rhizobium leguminosarum TaxID=384 RepID=UPI001030D05F|nr:hypothetical protein [Rhizobium leguminosarum]TBG52618.1 hypothetical protein ELG74_36615 [Rhizobium leguminosarum]
MKSFPILAVLACAPSPAFAIEDRMETTFDASWTTNCPGPYQCSLEIFDRSQIGKRSAAFIVATNDPAADPVCSYVFPVIPNADGLLATATRDFVLKIALVDSGLYVDGIPDRLCGVRLDGHYRELGD